MALLVDPRGRKTVISWRDMVFITEITAGPHPLRSCFYAVYVRAAPAVNIKLFIDADVFFFFLKRPISLTCGPGRPTLATPASPWRGQRTTQMRSC